ncbi:phosphatase PAP2 family protein [Sulfitobacter aestuarii]|uniref:Phosphatase PAP2 family protein n=1 Tax=Sulfitobacter aestuarii TaxID=2161676 RepID=A0ABW5U0K2_9RHOB
MDLELLSYLNSLIGRVPEFDIAYRRISSNPVTKGIPIIALLWFFWGRRKEGAYVYRPQVLSSILIAMIALLAGRLLALTFPHRLRPLHDPDVSIILPEWFYEDLLDGWSSMPSDHAVFYAALCVCIFYMNRLAGVLALIYSLVVVLVPRIFFGLHWPSDIAVGILIGGGLAAIAHPVFTGWAIRQRWMERVYDYEALFYVALFFVTFQMATMFNSARAMASLAAKTARYLTGL